MALFPKYKWILSDTGYMGIYNYIKGIAHLKVKKKKKNTDISHHQVSQEWYDVFIHETQGWEDGDIDCTSPKHIVNFVNYVCYFMSSELIWLLWKTDHYLIRIPSESCPSQFETGAPRTWKHYRSAAHWACFTPYKTIKNLHLILIGSRVYRQHGIF